MSIKVLFALVLIAAMSGSKILHDSNATFKQALSACEGSLGSVSFALGHARIAASPGVDTEESAADPNGVVSIMLQDASGAKAAQVSIDQKNRSVSAKHIRLEMNATVACILPD